MPSADASEGGWTFRPAPFDDELLSSYLTRIALLHGTSPYRFCAWHFPHASVWNRDIDRSASGVLLEKIGQAAGMPASRLRNMLIDWGDRNSGGDCPWVTAVGIYHRKRRRYGLTYCSSCLDEQPGFRRLWRHSLVTTCSRHRALLSDACPRCDAPLTPHRQELSITSCSACGADLRRAFAHPAPAELLALQRSASAEPIELERSGDPVSQVEFLRGLRVLLPVVTALASRGALTRQNVMPSLERCRVHERRLQLSSLLAATEPWPTRFRAYAARHRLAQPAFGDPRTWPHWLGRELAGLPAGHRWQYSSINGLKSVAARLDSIRTSGEANWRGTHAQLILRSLRKVNRGH